MLFTGMEQSLFAQSESMPVKPKAGYIFPILPGKPNTLSGSMGELRSTHFHSGIDVRTNDKTGLPVHAIQKGYVSRAVKGPYGFGNVLYVTHPDGNTSLYAHLDEFKGRIARIALEEQYKRKASNVDLRFQPGEVPITRGDTIALSGNTGSSAGPHLHFDIRDPQMNALNPLSFGFTEIVDKLPPIVLKVALRTMDNHSRINGRFGRFIFDAVRVGTTFRLADSVRAIGSIGIELLAHDVMDNSRFKHGINEFVMTANDTIVFTQYIRKVEVSDSRGILTVLDNEEMERTGNRYYRMYVADGNPMDMYGKLVNKGIVRVSGMVNKKIRVVMKDTYGNPAQLAFNLHPVPLSSKISHPSGNPEKPGFRVSGHWLHVWTTWTDTTKVRIYSGKNSNELQPDYHDGHNGHFILDLRKAVPDSLTAGKQVFHFNIRERIPSGIPYKFYGPGFTINFQKHSLFDTLYLDFHSTIEGSTSVLVLSDQTIPLFRPIEIEWKPSGKITGKSAVYRLDGNDYERRDGTWSNGSVTFSTNRMGRFVILQDNTAPTISLISANADVARLKIRDERSGIASYQATIGGEWVALRYDYKTGIVFTEKRIKNTPLKGELVVRVTDHSGNVASFKHNIP